MKQDSAPLADGADKPPTLTLPSPEEIYRLRDDEMASFILRLASLQAAVSTRLHRGPVNTEGSESDPDRLVDVQAAAEFLALPASYVAELGRRGLLPRVTFGKYVRFCLADLRAWIHAHRDSGID